MCSVCFGYGCRDCEDPDEYPESDLERAQRKKREEDTLRAAGLPTLRAPLLALALQTASRSRR